MQHPSLFSDFSPSGFASAYLCGFNYKRCPELRAAMKYEGRGNRFGHLFMSRLGLASRGTSLVAWSGFLATGDDDRANCAHGRRCRDTPDLPFHKVTGKNSLFRTTKALFQRVITEHQRQRKQRSDKNIQEEKTVTARR